MKFYEVFKTGTYPQGKFTKKDIEKIAENYDPKFCEAPVTIDHVQSGPAYGWIDNVKAENDKLKVSFKDVPEEFEKEVNAGKYKKVSVELYKNLEGKGHYLKAVSFLGAAIPQVKGLEPIKFMDSESEIYEFEAEISEDEQKFTQADIDDLKKQIETLENQLAKFKEMNKKTETIKSLKEKISALNEEISAFKEKAEGKEQIEQELNNIKTVIKEQEYNKFIDEQIDKGRLVPADKRTILSIFNELDNIKQFGEDSTAVSGFKSFIESLNPRIEFKETAVKSKQISVKAESDKFSDADEESLAVFQEAKNLAEKEKISFKEALLKLNI